MIALNGVFLFMDNMTFEHGISGNNLEISIIAQIPPNVMAMATIIAAANALNAVKNHPDITVNAPVMR